jgi:ATP-dependent helicase/nuclease subunit B
MVAQVRWTGYGEPAALALRDAVAAAKGGDPLAPVTVVVPSNHVGVASRRLLASGRLGPVAGTGIGIAAVTFLTTYRLAELLGAPTLAASGRRPVSTPVIAAAVRAELAIDAGLFGPVKEHPATEAALVSTYRELRDLSPGALDALARASARAAEVVRLHRAVRARLAPTWSDEEDLLDAATALAAGPRTAELGALVVHLPQRVTQHGGRLLAALADHLPTTVIVGLTGLAEADDEVLRSLARLGIAAPVPTVEVGIAPEVDRERTTILTASDGDEEARAAVRAVLEAVRAGTRLDRIAVLHASPEPYARLAHEQLRAADVATNGAAVLPLAARMAGRTLLELLALPEDRFRRQDVFAWLSSAPVMIDGHPAPTTAWERLSRDAAVVADRTDWDVHLLQLAAQLEQRAEELDHDPDASDWAAQRAREDAGRAQQLRRFVLAVIDDLRRASSQPRTWREHATWAQGWLVRLLGPAESWERWGEEDEHKAAERVLVALDRLGALGAVEGPVDLRVFARTLEVELDNDLGRVGRFGDGVLVGSVEMGVGLDLDLVIVLGLAEGSFPARVRDDSLLPDGERAATQGELALRADRVERQHRELLAALSGARSHLLCVPRGDLRRSAERVPSRWVLDIAGALAGSPTGWWAADLLRSTEPWVRHVASFDAGIRTLAVPATDQEHRLRALLAEGGRLSATDDARTAAGAAVVAGRRSPEFTRFDGNLSGLPIPSPIDKITSPTRLERWASCPHRHLVEDILRAAPVENPEDVLMITPIDKGNLVHEALERFLETVVALPPEQRPAPSVAWTSVDLERLLQIGSALCDSYEALGKTGRRIFWKRDRRRILADLERFLVVDSARRATDGTRPFAVELAFGFDGELAPVPFALPDGRTLHFRGRADRLDLANDGTLHVVDYKTGKSDRYKVLSESEPVVRGTMLQLPVYGLAGRMLHGRDDAPVVAEYWFVTSRGRFERKGYRITDDVLDRARAVLGTIVTGIEGGAFPPHPAAMKSTSIFIDCHVCDPDGLGTVELRQHWERKRQDPAMAGYAELAEPLALAAEDDPADTEPVPA